MQKGVIFINGEFVPIEKAGISVLDLSVQRGYGVIEVLRTYGRRPFLLGEHLRRLDRSVKLMLLKNAPKRGQIRKIIAAGLRKMSGELLIKILVTGGPGRHITPLGRPGLVVFFLPFQAHPKSDYQKGFRMMTTKLRRTLPQAKSVDYFSAILAQVEAENKGYDEAIFTDGPRLLEGTTFNIGVIIGRDLTVPKKDVLEGSTMLATLKVAARVGLRVKRRDVKFADLKSADEMISTSTIREILPIVRVDNIRIGSGKPGKYARILLEEFREYAKRHKDKE